MHLSKFAEDLIVFGTNEFGFVKFADAYSTGSSLMPQKKNPDALELLRGKAAGQDAEGAARRRCGGPGRPLEGAAMEAAVGTLSPLFWDLQARRRARSARDLVSICHRSARAARPPRSPCSPRSPLDLPAGHTTTLLTMLKGLPTAYNKDLQEDKAALFDALDTVEASLQIASGVLATITPVPERMKASLNSFMLATDLSEYLVRRGVPFRETHHVSGRAVQLAEERGCALTDLTLADLQGLHPLFADDVMGVWDFEAAVERRDATGGTSKRSVLQQAATLEAWSNEK